MEGADIRFPHLGIELEKVGRSISVFGFPIAYYGIIITTGMLIGYFMAEWTAKRTNQDKEIYLDFALYAIIFSVIGARFYYVIFSWDEFKDNLIQIVNLRSGGLAIYGGIIAGVITAFVYSYLKRIRFGVLADTACIGLITGQIIGRWGNFFNREAFGGYTNNIFAMQLKKSQVYPSNITQELLDHIVVIDNVEYIQVHPTFLYESVWNLGVLLLLVLYTKRKKFDGEIFFLYLIGYGLGRFWIEGLRTDQLLLWGTNLAISQYLSLGVVIIAIIVLMINRVKRARRM